MGVCVGNYYYFRGGNGLGVFRMVVLCYQTLIHESVLFLGESGRTFRHCLGNVHFIIDWIITVFRLWLVVEKIYAIPNAGARVDSLSCHYIDDIHDVVVD
jgi:hypothetical protein